MAGYEAMFGEKVQESMLDMDAVAAELVGRSGLGRDGTPTAARTMRV
jgi:hypothetical protein